MNGVSSSKTNIASAQNLIRRECAISRARVWTEHLKHKLALRDKMCAFLGRGLSYASSCNQAQSTAMSIRDPGPLRDSDASHSRTSGAHARRMLHELARKYAREHNYRACSCATRPPRTCIASSMAIGGSSTMTLHAQNSRPRAPTHLPTPPQSNVARNAPSRSRKAAARGGGIAEHVLEHAISEQLYAL